jgi:hypothetical protein
MIPAGERATVHAALDRLIAATDHVLARVLARPPKRRR